MFDFGGCDTTDVVAALGLSMSDLFDEDREAPRLVFPSTPRSASTPKVTEYAIRDAAGAVVAVHVREDTPTGKRITWKRPDGQFGLNGTPVSELPLFGSESAAEWDVTRPIVVTEGEKAAAVLIAAGIPTVATVTGAATVPAREPLAVLAGLDVVLWPDNDEPGRRHMRELAASLTDIAASVRWVAWPEAPEHGDAADFLATHDVADVETLLEAATDAPPDERPATHVPEPSRNVTEAERWPEPLHEDALHGLVGEFVRRVEPYSESDRAALLMHVAGGLAALTGGHVHALAGDAVHPARLNAVLVGVTAKGRKDSAARPAGRLLREADEQFAAGRVTEGLSSGEGLIHAVRDRVVRFERVGKGEAAGIQEVEADPGVSDKRLLVIESEFASVLRVAQRDGNILSAVLRRAWDSGDLRVLVKNSPTVATGAHICIVGHVTRDELLRYLDRTELASGFANRFLWLAVRRARVLPDGDGVPEDVVRELAGQVRAVQEWASFGRLPRRDDAATALWRDEYEELSSGRPGMLGAATSRAEAQVLRLSVLYAMVDRSTVIGVEHLRAALAVWRYAEQSARWVFGDATGDPTADTILRALRQAGELDRTGIVDLFGRHANRGRVEGALALLLSAGTVQRIDDRETGGRPREVWRAT
ncbi:MAG: hypothetical protein ABR509_04905 [Candidatus Limnocylindria bacterium]